MTFLLYYFARLPSQNDVTSESYTTSPFFVTINTILFVFSCHSGSWVEITSSLDARSLAGSSITNTPATVGQIPTSDPTTSSDLVNDSATLPGKDFTEVKQVGLRCMEKLLLDASRESVMSSFSPRDGLSDCEGIGSQSISPISPSSPLMLVEGDSLMMGSNVSFVEAMLMSKDDLMERGRRISSDWLWDWSTVSPAASERKSGQRHPSSSSSKADQSKSQQMQLKGQKLMEHQLDWRTFLEQQAAQKKLSLRQWATRRGFFSKEVLSIFLLSNILSLILGAGIGYTVLIRRSL